MDRSSCKTKTNNWITCRHSAETGRKVLAGSFHATITNQQKFGMFGYLVPHSAVCKTLQICSRRRPFWPRLQPTSCRPASCWWPCPACWERRSSSVPPQRESPGSSCIYRETEARMNKRDGGGRDGVRGRITRVFTTIMWRSEQKTGKMGEGRVKQHEEQLWKVDKPNNLYVCSR